MSINNSGNPGKSEIQTIQQFKNNLFIHNTHCSCSPLHTLFTCSLYYFSFLYIILSSYIYQQSDLFLLEQLSL